MKEKNGTCTYIPSGQKCEDQYCFVYRGFHFDMTTNLNMYIATI